MKSMNELWTMNKATLDSFFNPLFSSEEGPLFYGRVANVQVVLL